MESRLWAPVKRVRESCPDRGHIERARLVAAHPANASRGARRRVPHGRRSCRARRERSVHHVRRSRSGDQSRRARSVSTGCYLRQPVAVLRHPRAVFGRCDARGASRPAVCASPVDPRDGPSEFDPCSNGSGSSWSSRTRGFPCPARRRGGSRVVERVAGPADHAPGVVADPEAPALVYLTSGSTGWPKVVAHTHAASSASSGSEIELTELTPDDRVSVLFPLAFLGSLVMFGGAPAQRCSGKLLRHRQPRDRRAGAVAGRTWDHAAEPVPSVLYGLSESLGATATCCPDPEPRVRG